MAADWERVRAIFAEVADMPPAERATHLDQAAPGAEDRAEIERLLRHHDAPGEFLDSPALPRPDTEVVPDDWEPPAPAEVGRMVGPYKLRRVIGEGGMGAVFLAERDDEYRREVAIKLIRRSHHGDALVRFRAERQILAGLEHPNIARLYDGGTADDGRPYLVMEYVEGRRIDTYCKNAALGIEDRLRLFQQVCAAVDYAHRNLLVHRDLKPANILVTHQGVVKLLDFGIAKSLQNGDAGTTRPGESPMTPAYASPEQVRSKPITTASDVYSLGVVLYELLTGVSPYLLDDDSDLTLQVAIRDQDPARPSVAARMDGETGTHTRQLRGDLDAVILMALRKEPERRYASVGELSADIGRYLGDLPVLARRASLSYRVGKFARRHRLGVGVVAVALILLVGFVAALIRQTQIANRQSAIAAEQRDRAELTRDAFVDAFSASDPEQAQGREVTVREMLDQGAAKVRRSLATDPESQATLLAAMAEVYTSLGIFDTAGDLHLEAHELRRGSADEGVSLFQRGELEWYRRDYHAAEDFYQQALAVVDDPIQRGRILRGLGLALIRQGEHGDGDGHLISALTLLRGHFDDVNPEILRCLYGLAFAAAERADYEEAAELYQQVITARRELGAGPALGRNLAGLGIVRYRQGELDDAKRLLEEALPMLRKVMGSDNAYVAEVLGKLVAVRGRLGDEAGAEEAIREILAILPADHPGTGTALHNLGMILSARGDLVDAKRVTTDALRIQRTSFGETHENVALSLCHLGGIALGLDDSRGAQRHYEDCATVMKAVHPPEHPQNGFALLGLGRTAEALEGCNAAAPWYRRTYNLWQEGLGEEHYQTISAAGRLGTCLAELGDDTEAERLLVDGLEQLRASAASQPRICGAAKRLADFYRTRGMDEKLHEATLPSCTE